MKNRLLAKSLAGLTAGAMLAGSMPVTAFAVTGEQVAADGTYTAEAAVVNDEAITEGDEWENYNVTVTVNVADGLIASIGTTDSTDESATYLAKAVSKKKGINTLLAGQPATAAAVEGWEAVSGATIVSNAVKAAALEALAGAPEAVTEPEVTYSYVLMNIPYEKFYENEINDGDHAVDAVSSATTDMKTHNFSLFAGTYREESANAISGITYPVKVTAGVDLSAYTVVTDETTGTASWAVHGTANSHELSGSDCLFNCGDYAYYVLADEPAAYKELTAGEDGTLSFGASTAAVNAADGVTATLAASSAYGDYQLNISGLDYAKVLGIAANTAERSYAFRHLENIWRGGMQVAFTAGITTTERHGNDISGMADYYKDIMGQTITSLTVYGVDADGNYVTDNYDIEDLYVAKKTAAKVAAEDIMDTDTALPVTVADDAEGVYTVFTVDDAAVTAADGKADVSALGLTPGSHTVKVVDAAGEYAPISDSFTVTTATMPAAYDDAAVSLVAADGATAEAFAAYLKNITKVSVNGTSYNASGRGAVKVVGDDGAVDQSKLSYGANELVVTSTGYPELAFTANKLFTDVTDPEAWYYDAVYWAASEGITSGYGEGTFQPKANLTRAQTVMFLYKMAGQPDVSDVELTFSDVAADAWYADAVKWAVANEITTGYGEGTFQPSVTCKRSMIVTFIKRYAEKIAGTYTAPAEEASFSDVAADAWYKESVDWAVANGITTGYGEGTFQPNVICNRAMMVTFLQRLSALDGKA